MTCFWDAIIKKLNREELSLLGISRKINPSILCKQCIQKNKIVDENIHWQGEKLKKQERLEHFQTIKDYGCHVWNGHLTSSCDSFLLFLTDICKINIEHRGAYGTSNYTNPEAKRMIIVSSNRGHMW